MEGIDYLNSMRCSIVVHAHLLHPAQSHDQLAKKFVSLLAISLARQAKARSQKQGLGDGSGNIFLRIELLRPLHARVHCYLINVPSIQEASV